MGASLLAPAKSIYYISGVDPPAILCVVVLFLAVPLTA